MVVDMLKILVGLMVRMGFWLRIEILVKLETFVFGSSAGWLKVKIIMLVYCATDFLKKLYRYKKKYAF